MIEAIALAIAVPGMVLWLLLFSRIRAVEAVLQRKRKMHRAQDEGLADLLNYAAVVGDGVIVGKNGSFMAAWLYKGDDNASSTDEQREMVSFRINQALAGLGNGWMLHVDAVRRPAPNYAQRGVSAFPDVLSRAIDEERRRLFEGLGAMFEGYFVLTVTWFPPVLAQRKFVELMFDDDAQTPDHTARTLGLIEQFRREAATLESRLSSALKLARLRGQKLLMEEGREVTHDDFLGWLQFCVTGQHHPVQLPGNPMYLDALIGGQEMWSGVVPKIGRHFIQIVAIEGFPLESSPGILSALAELPCAYRWSSRFIFMDQHASVQHLDKFRKKWRQKVRGFFDQVFNTHTGSINQDAAAMVGDAEAAIAEVNSGLVAAGYYTSVVVLMDEDRVRLASSALHVEKAINRLAFAARIETINTLDAYLGSLPGHGVENVRRPLMNTLNLADLLPTSAIWTGSASAPCPMYPPLSPALMHCVTVGATPFRLNLHVRDLGHSFMFGPTGAGKSTHLGILAAQLRRYAGMSIYAFDKGLSMYPLAAGIRAVSKGKSGLHFTVAADDEHLAFCPMQFLETKGDRAWAMEWIDTILALNGVTTTPAQRNEIGTAIMSMHASGARTLSEFSVTIQDEAIREAIKQYTVDGSMGHLLDAEEDGLALSDFTVFEIEELMNLGEKFALPVLLYLFRRIERALQGQPAAIILDEAWLMLGHPVFRAKIREWLKVLRKANCLVLMATQSLSDAANSGILDVILESTATKIFLPNVYARDEDTAALYRRMGLNARQIEILAGAIPKRQYYYVSESGRRLYDLALGPLALSFVGATDKESVGAMKNLEARFGHDWIHTWLASRGLNLNDYLEAAWALPISSKA
ncbi:VirB4 family type IV secretion/conjugal transfer ATPase [Verminephrobacter aporrectodeae subsp. tuberculatae]|uniref:Type IV secretion system protein virB4 n=1 Tax=Verminephrobacter aporrectodeae subsp. tuberculatae TaxID=1110392 RepID=A0ABT3KU94_9BURK|nr:VirB4 family type IV secretion/conjugal transfer ATPase [Verminephrobacter aporrectodeae subsp. tuberculatae]MCW5256886.1 VirB4 family type IV secretion/conjugal transfer ATPase [Verminephrobacter aporrectodeae subsp. tuberculatae]MCW5288360.1 VirB4 family type IV secretion/conjugal transfer ATPase [Verminephrobacter aporrectodeae subsp. tuberculatae]MCW5321902.1 VirB4 family type IV secretion/conjugal transfer ATPase [Verminephrobacter aporrectodeae subsp. tuberculatae]MCW8166492.1 VirB4 fa